jgi:hypothetical protein
VGGWHGDSPRGFSEVRIIGSLTASGSVNLNMLKLSELHSEKSVLMLEAIIRN